MYKYSIQMLCNGVTNEELHSLFEKEVEALGYDYEKPSLSSVQYHTVVNRLGKQRKFTDYWLQSNGDRILIKEFYPELFLAIAAIRDNDGFHYGEYVITLLGKIRRIVGIRKDDNWLALEGEYTNKLPVPSGVYDYSTHPEYFNMHNPAYLIKCTIEEICEHFGFEYNKEQKTITKKQIMDNLLIGYKLKKDMPNIDAGTIFSPDGKYTPKVVKEGVKYYYDKLALSDEEWFEPIYEQTYKVGDWVILKQGFDHCEGNEPFIGVPVLLTEIIPHRNYEGEVHDVILFAGKNRWTFYYENIERKATPEEIKAATTVRIGKYDVEIRNNKVWFGCKGFTEHQLEAILLLFNDEINAKVEIHGVKITYATIQKLLALLHNNQK